MNCEEMLQAIRQDEGIQVALRCLEEFRFDPLLRQIAEARIKGDNLQRSLVNEARDMGRVEGRTEGRAEGEQVGLQRGEQIGHSRGKAEGKAEGRVEGEMAAKRKLALRLLASGQSPEEVASLLEVSETELRGLVAEDRA